MHTDKRVHVSELESVCLLYSNGFLQELTGVCFMYVCSDIYSAVLADARTLAFLCCSVRSCVEVAAKSRCPSIIFSRQFFRYRIHGAY